MRRLLALEITTFLSGVLIAFWGWSALERELGPESPGGDSVRLGTFVNNCPVNPPSIRALILHDGDLDIDVDFAEWPRSNACGTLGILVNRPISEVEHSPNPEAPWETEVTLLPEPSPWDLGYGSGEGQMYLIDLSENTFSGSINFHLEGAMRPTGIGQRLQLSLGYMDASWQQNRPLEIALSAEARVDFSIPEPRAIRMLPDYQLFTFELDTPSERLDTADVFISVIDPRRVADRETSLIWVSTILGTGISIAAAAFFAALREVLES